MKEECALTANVNVVSLSVGKLVNMRRGQTIVTNSHAQTHRRAPVSHPLFFLLLLKAAQAESFERLLLCGKCSAALSRLSLVQRNVSVRIFLCSPLLPPHFFFTPDCLQFVVSFIASAIFPLRHRFGCFLSCSSCFLQVWLCEFCSHENTVSNGVRRLCVSSTSDLFSDELYLHTQSEDDYQNLEDTLVVFCVDISGSMSVTTEVAHKFSITAVVQSSDLKH